MVYHGMDRLQSRCLRFEGDDGKYPLTSDGLLRSIIGCTEIMVLLVSRVCDCVRVLMSRERAIQDKLACIRDRACKIVISKFNDQYCLHGLE